MIGTSNNPNSNKKTSPDLCFDTFVNRVAIRHDLLLLENQLPFFVLQDLFDLTVARIPIHLPILSDYLLSYFGNMMNPSEQSGKNDREQSHKNDQEQSHKNDREPKICHILHFLYNQYRQQQSHKNDPEPKICHILHFLYNQYRQQQSHKNDPEPKICHILHFLCNQDRQKQEVPSSTENKKKQQDSPKTNSMPPASELEYAGVKFEVSKDNPFEVQFEDPPVLFWCCRRASFKIPILRISAATERLLRNLIAFEQCYTGFDRNTGNARLDFYFTSYATLMDRLVDTENDVQVLEKAGVIYSRLGDREEASDLFHSLCKEIVLPRDSFYFAEACNQAASHSKRRWPKYLGYLRRTYFNNPWTFIAFLVAFIVFGIQVAQLVRNFLR
ncbi:hypothetical protein ACSBR1_003308 [Camellia fascicularis]